MIIVSAIEARVVKLVTWMRKKGKKEVDPADKRTSCKAFQSRWDRVPSKLAETLRARVASP